jgi:peptidoglycan/LPS O-acetylase OafA/YrhL
LQRIGFCPQARLKAALDQITSITHIEHCVTTSIYNKTEKLVLLEYIRGVAAISVALSHYIMRIGDSSMAEQVAMISVEIFFPLSGFVLASQINSLVRDPTNLWTFLIRRWMRTVPVYLLALFSITYLLNETINWNFFSYAIFIKYASAEFITNDYFPISWSLAVEEWYYLIIPLLLVTLTRFDNLLRNLSFLLVTMFLFILIFKGLVYTGDPFERISTFFRLDTILIGYLFYNFLFKKDFNTVKLWSFLIIWVTLVIWYFEQSEVDFHSGYLVTLLTSASFGALITVLADYETRNLASLNQSLRNLGLWCERISYPVIPISLADNLCVFPRSLSQVDPVIPICSNLSCNSCAPFLRETDYDGASQI